MADEDRNQVEIRLQRLEELFTAPALDPLNGQFHAMSGIEQIMVKLGPESLDIPLHATIILPPDTPTEGLVERTIWAVRGYCADRIQQIDLEKARVKRQGFKELRLGLIFLAVCLAVSGGIEALDIGPELLRKFVVEGLIIVGWIALWHPVDLLLFDRWPRTRDQRMLTHIQNMEIAIRTEA